MIWRARLPRGAAFGLTLKLALALTVSGVLPTRSMEIEVAHKDPVLSAEVVLAPASGKPIAGAAITAENVKAFSPPPELAEKARRFFREAGFQVSDLGGISFTISAPRSVFERFFGTKIATETKGLAKAAQDRRTGSIELPLNRLPPEIRPGVTAVTFSRPIDFGPTGSYSR